MKPRKLKQNISAAILCLSLGFFAFSLVSRADIDVQVTATVEGCGDGAIGAGEECDGANLNGASCVSQGFDGGTLSCGTFCLFNTTSCTLGGGGGGGGIRTPIRETDTESPKCGIADFNCDTRVDILDFSILLYYESSGAGSTLYEEHDLSGDQKINMVDISIMFYYWTNTEV